MKINARTECHRQYVCVQKMLTKRGPLRLLSSHFLSLARDGKWYWNIICFYWVWVDLPPSHSFLWLSTYSPGWLLCVAAVWLVRGGVKKSLWCRLFPILQRRAKSELGARVLAKKVWQEPCRCVYRLGQSMSRPLHAVSGASESAGGFGSPL